MESFCSTRKKR